MKYVSKQEQAPDSYFYECYLHSPEYNKMHPKNQWKLSEM